MKSGAMVLVITVLAGCAGRGARPAAVEPPQPVWITPPGESDGRACYVTPRAHTFVFRCRDSSFAPGPPNGSSFDNRERLEGLMDELVRPLGIELVVLHGQQSGAERDMPITLSQARAESVARALARRGYPAWRIVALADGHDPGTAAEPDACRPPEEDTGHPHRRVRVDVVRCVARRDYEWLQLGRYPDGEPAPRGGSAPR